MDMNDVGIWRQHILDVMQRTAQALLHEVLVNMNLLELSAQKSFLKDDALTIKLSAYDVLNRRISDSSVSLKHVTIKAQPSF